MQGCGCSKLDINACFFLFLLSQELEMDDLVAAAEKVEGKRLPLLASAATTPAAGESGAELLLPRRLLSQFASSPTCCRLSRPR